MDFKHLSARDARANAAAMGARPNARFGSVVGVEYSARDNSNNKRHSADTVPRSDTLPHSAAGDHLGPLNSNNNALPRTKAQLRGTTRGDNLERGSSNNNNNNNNNNALRWSNAALRSTRGDHSERDSDNDSDSNSRTAIRRRPRRTVDRRRNLKATCGKGQQFAIASKSFPLSEGCYSQLTQYNGEAMYSPARDGELGNFVVGATQGDASDPNDVRNNCNRRSTYCNTALCVRVFLFIAFCFPALFFLFSPFYYFGLACFVVSLYPVR